jgi:DNA-binding GntR family transcriptional regulator
METYITKAGMVYEYIKGHILNGKFVPGMRINPKELSIQLGVSLVPVREAVNKLSSDGLIKVTPHIGARVANINRSEVDEIQMIRTELECLATGLLAGEVTNEQIGKLEKIVAESEKAFEQGKYDLYQKLNKRFHFTLYESSPYQILATMIKELYQKLQLVPTLPWTRERAEKSLREHKEILSALANHDGTLARNTLRKHQSARWHAIQDLAGKRRTRSSEKVTGV